MANEIRVRQNITKGKISDSPLTVGASQINSPQFAQLPVIDATMHMPLTLAPAGVDGVGTAVATEIVWVIGHAANATVVNVLRGQEGTSATQYSINTAWAHAQTAWDFPAATGSAFLGTDVNLYRTTDQYGPAGVATDDSLNVRGGYGAGDWSPNRVVVGSGGTSPNAATVTFGNNTGWLLNFGTMVGSAFDTRFSFDDRGRFVVAAPAGATVNLQEWTVGGVTVAYWTATGQLFFGADTNLSRTGPSTLKANGSFQLGGAITMLNGANITITSGAGSPEGVVTANPGSTYHNTSGGTGTTYYVKESGTGNTGWVPAGSAGGGGVAAHQTTHQTGGSDALTGNIDANARTSIAISGGVVGTRRQLNLIPGTGVTFTNAADDAANERVTVQINSSGGGGGAAQVYYNFYQGIPGGGGQSCLDSSPFFANHFIGGSDTGGIHFSYDAGKTWKVKQNGVPQFNGRKVCSVKYSRTVPSRAFAAVGSGTAGNGGIYYTIDDGSLWRRLDTGTEVIVNGGNNTGAVLPSPSWPRSCGNLIDLDEANGHVYIGSYANGVYRIDFTVNADGTLTQTATTQISGTAGLYIRAIKLLKSFQKVVNTNTLFIAPYANKLMVSTNANAGSPSATSMSAASTPQNVEALEVIAGNGTSAATALYACNAGGVHVSTNPTAAAASITFTNIAGGSGPETTGPTWMALRGYENSAGQYVIYTGSYNGTASSAPPPYAGGIARFNCVFKGVAAGANPTTGVTWTVLGVDWTKIHKNLWHEEKQWWLPNEINQLGGSTFACPEITINEYAPEEVVLASRATNWKTEDAGATWYPVADGVGAVGIGLFAADPRTSAAGRLFMVDTDHVGYITKNYFYDLYFNQYTNPDTGTVTNTGRAAHIRGVDGRVTASGGKSGGAASIMDALSSVMSSLDPLRDTWRNERWDTFDGAVTWGTTKMAQPIGVLSGIDAGGVEFYIGVADGGFGLWRKQKTGTWTGANNAGSQVTITADNWGRMLPVANSPANRGNEPFSTTIDVVANAGGDTTRNKSTFAPLISTGTTTGSNWGQHVFTIDQMTGIVWRFSDYGRTAGVQVWSKGSEITAASNVAGWIFLDTVVSGRLWISSDNGLFYIDNALTITTPAAGTKVAFGAAGSGLPYAGEYPGPIGMYGDGTLCIAVQGVDPSGILKTPRFLEVTNPASGFTAVDLADETYRGQCVWPQSMQIDSSNLYAYVGCYGSGIEVCQRIKRPA